jgi:DNA-binding NarL/FixJ family response regulator
MDPLIFLVDDNPTVTSLVKKKLENEGFMNLMVFNTYESLLKDLDKSPQIIILDNYLDLDDNDPEISLERFKQLKRRLPNTHIIIFSGETDPDVIHAFIFRGADTYITKNLEALDKLVFAIKQIVHHKL